MEPNKRADVPKFPPIFLVGLESCRWFRLNHDTRQTPQGPFPSMVVHIADGRDHQSTILINMHVQ